MAEVVAKTYHNPLRHTFYQKDLAMTNTADVTCGEPMADRSQSIVNVSAVNPLVTFYNIC
jgi:hypothetical protein